MEEDIRKAVEIYLLKEGFIKQNKTYLKAYGKGDYIVKIKEEYKDQVKYDIEVYGDARMNFLTRCKALRNESKIRKKLEVLITKCQMIYEY